MHGLDPAHVVRHDFTGDIASQHSCLHRTVNFIDCVVLGISCFKRD